MSMHSEATLNRRFVEFAKQLNLYLNHFPHAEKYGLAQAIRVAAYDVYALIVEAQKRYHKKTTLAQLDIRHEQLRMLLALANELGYFGFHGGTKEGDADEPQRATRRYLTISRMVDELGRIPAGGHRGRARDAHR